MSVNICFYLDKVPDNDPKQSNNNEGVPDFKKRMHSIRKPLLLSIAYAANVGGTGTLTGTGTNIAFEGIFHEWDNTISNIELNI